jgi:hypothetical protein
MKAPSKEKIIRDPFPAGTHHAICYGVVDMGTQEVKSTMYGDKMKRQIRLQWEVPKFRVSYETGGVESEGPKVIGKTYTFSMYSKAKLAEHLTAWGFSNLDNLDTKDLLGANCLLGVAHFTKPDPSDPNNRGKDQTFSFVSSVQALVDGMETKQPENPLMYYSIEEHGKEIPSCVYPWMLEAIGKSSEFAAMEHAKGVLGEPDLPDDIGCDDIPF